MTGFLLFTLYAPLASFGDIAVGEHRQGWDRPGKSAVLGLVAAALGLDRSEEAAHQALSEGYGFAVRIDIAGRALEDFHTVEIPRARRGGAWATRREELAALDEKDNPVVSRREYVSDGLYTAALWARAGARWSLPDFAKAMRYPVFTLYLGRKSCPLGLPLAPELVTADTLEQAFAKRKPWPFPDHLHISLSGQPMLYADMDAPGCVIDDGQRVRRRDSLSSRGRWQFADRDEMRYRLSAPQTENPS